MKQLIWLLLHAFFLLIVSMSFILAAPNIQINSPQSITYSTTKVLVNISSNETVDFYLKNLRNNLTVKLNSTIYESSLYGKTGNYNFIIYANNSNGISSKNVSFSISASNPINITSCGLLISPNARYEVMNDLSGECINWREDVNNATFDINGFKIESNSWPITINCFFSEILNGTLNHTADNNLAGLDIQNGDSCLFKDLNIESLTNGISIYTGDRMLF